MDIITGSSAIKGSATASSILVGILTWLGAVLPAWITILTFIWFVMLIGEKLYTWYKKWKEKTPE